MPCTLVPMRVSAETVTALEQLLYDAKRGLIHGVAYVAIGSQWAYTADTTGIASTSPTFTAGALTVLAQKIIADDL